MKPPIPDPKEPPRRRRVYQRSLAGLAAWILHNSWWILPGAFAAGWIKERVKQLW